MASRITLHDGFRTIDEAIRKVEASMHESCPSIRRETKETVRNFNKKCRKDDRRITELSEDAQYSQRFVELPVGV